jgi:hypothetical protein
MIEEEKTQLEALLEIADDGEWKDILKNILRRLSLSLFSQHWKISRESSPS